MCHVGAYIVSDVPKAHVCLHRAHGLLGRVHDTVTVTGGWGSPSGQESKLGILGIGQGGVCPRQIYCPKHRELQHMLLCGGMSVFMQKWVATSVSYPCPLSGSNSSATQICQQAKTPKVQQELSPRTLVTK